MNVYARNFKFFNFHKLYFLLTYNPEIGILSGRDRLVTVAVIIRIRPHSVPIKQGR